MAEDPTVKLFWRSYTVSIAPPEGGVKHTFGNVQGDGAALRIAFEIKKVAPGAANTGTLVLYNLSQDIRTLIKNGTLIELHAGYRNFAELLFKGTVFQASTKRSGPDIVTTAELLDGLDALLYAHIDRSYAPGTDLPTILKDVGEAMKVDAGTCHSLPIKTYPRGYHANGSCRDVLEDLLSPLGFEASVQNNKLNILRIGDPLTAAFIEISSKTGLLGIPSKSLVAVQFEALLNPLLVPGTYVRLTTKNNDITGLYVIRSCTQAGDTHDTKWSVACEAVVANELGKVLKGSKGFTYSTAVQGLGTL